MPKSPFQFVDLAILHGNHGEEQHGPTKTIQYEEQRTPPERRWHKQRHGGENERNHEECDDRAHKEPRVLLNRRSKRAHTPPPSVIDSVADPAIEVGVDVALAATGVAAAAGGPAAAAVAAIVSPVARRPLVQMLTLIKQRWFSEREQRQILTAVSEAARHIQAQLDTGKTLRADGWFDGTTDAPSSAEDIAVAVVRAAGAEAQTKKVPYYGRLLGALAFETVDPDTAHLLVHIADTLTYRQLCLMKLAYRAVDPPPVREVGVSLPLPYAAVWEELTRLQELGVMHASGAPPERTLIALTRLAPIGQALHELMGLAQLPDDDIDQTRRALWAGVQWAIEYKREYNQRIQEASRTEA